MKLNRKWLLVIALVLSLAMTTAGTLAYLTDRDSAANVFTVGNVEIDLIENFDQGAQLLPGSQTTNEVKKETFIKNTGKSDAWVWMTMAIPAALDDDDTSTVGEVNALHWNVPGVVWQGYGDDPDWTTQEKINTALANGWITKDHLNAGQTAVKNDCVWTICQTADAPVEIKTETIDEVDYNVYTFLYNGPLASGDTTPVALHQVYLDQKIDVDPDGNWYIVENGVATEVGWNSNTNGSPIIYVSAYAMQKDEFETVLEAYNAYNNQWTTTDGKNNGIEWGEPSKVVGDQDGLKDALENGGSAILDNDVDTDAGENSGYGDAGIVVDNGATFNGNGNTYTVNKANTTWDCAIAVKWGTVKNLTVSGAMRGIFMPSANGDVYIDNVTFDDVIYTFNSDSGSKEYGVYISNSTLNGWTSFTNKHKEVVFTNCTFGEGNGYAFCRPYNNPSVFTNCVFEEGFEFDTTQSSSITFNNCYYGDTLITAENAATLGKDDTTFFTDASKITIK